MNQTTAPGSTARRIGAIDVGTNSIRLIVAEAGLDGSYRVLDDEKETTRLGQGLETTGEMAPEAMLRAAQALARMKSIADGLGVETLRVIGTCAVREATNQADFLALVRQRAGIPVEPISPAEEAHLAHLSVTSAFDLRGLNVVVADIGGGSTELILSSGGVVEEVYSLPLGAVRVTEQFGDPDECVGGRYRAMRRCIRHTLERTIGKSPFVPQLLIGTGGTFTSLANMSLQRTGSPAAASPSKAAVRGYEMKRPDVRHLVEWLRKMPLRARVRVPGLSPDRADIIVAGATIVDRVMKYLGVNRMRVHDGGVRDGLLKTMISSLQPASQASAPAPPDPMRSVRQFAAACGHEERHCEHVARLAGRLFDQLAACCPGPAGGWSEPANRPLLEAAALLKDVGYLINYAKHHRHSYHLIVHSELAGFTSREVQLVANLARYHRRARPKRKHANFAVLSKADRKLVCRLAAILRIADGLDRTRVQRVRDLTVHVEDGVARLELDAAENPAVEIWGATDKGRLFQRTFGLKPRFAWKSEPAPKPLSPAEQLTPS